MTAPVSIRDLMTDPQLFGGQFGGPSFAAWRALLAGFEGLPLDDDELRIYQALTGRTDAPSGPFAELWMAIGRRGGKTQAAALLAVNRAIFIDHRAKLSPGEVATILLIAADRAQARSAMRYVKGLCQHPMIAPMIRRETETTIEFDNMAAIEIATASFRSVRGYTLAAVIADEIAFWHADGANPDRETIAALRPGLATLGGPLIALSSPYARRGELWRTFKAHYGGDSDRILVAQAPSRTMNPTLAQAVIEQAMRDDREAAMAEWMAQFRSDISSLIAPELLEGCRRPKPLELPYVEDVSYHAFCDPSGGGADEFTLAIGHRENDHVVIDLVRGRKGNPAETVREFAEVLRRYRVRAVCGDRYAGQWPRLEFQKHGIEYQVSELDRSGLYLEFLAALNSGRVELPPCDMTLRQFAGLERRTSRSGKDSIDHAPGAHDDRANAIAGLVAMAKVRRLGTVTTKRVKGLV